VATGTAGTLGIMQSCEGKKVVLELHSTRGSAAVRALHQPAWSKFRGAATFSGVFP
jgi:hypothetical protein